MKMKFTLFAAAIAVLGFSASAQTVWKVVEPNPTLEEEDDITMILTPSAANSPTNEGTIKLPGFAMQGTADHKNLLIEGEDYLHNIYGKYFTDESTVGVYADGSNTYVRWRYNVKSKPRYRTVANSRQILAVKNECHKDMNSAYIHVFVGPKPAEATTDVLTPKLVIATDKNSTMAGSKAAVFTFPAITLTDEPQDIMLETTEISGDHVDSNWEGNPKTLYIDFYMDGVTTGQFLSFKDFGLGNIDRSVPVVGFESAGTRNLGFRGAQSVPAGTIFIQAENFDAFPEGETPRCMGADGGTDMWSAGFPNLPKKQGAWGYIKGDVSTVRVKDANSMNGGFGIYQKLNDTFTSPNAGDGFALVGMSAGNGDWGTEYKGEYLDETSNLISLEQAMDGFGSSWFSYTFEMEQDGYVDISFSAAAHNVAWYTNAICGGTTAAEDQYWTKYNKPREEGGYVVEGMDDDYFKTYGFCYVMEFDGELQRTNWDRFPAGNKRTGAISFTKWINPLSWESTQEIDKEGNAVNSYYLHITPSWGWQGNGTLWFPAYRCELYNTYYHHLDGEGGAGGIDTFTDEISPFKTACDELGADYFETNYKDRPDYADIPCSAGKHTIRVRSLGGATVFDEIKITAHEKANNSGIQGVKRNIIETGADAPAEYFDLQGRKVANPSNGIFIVKCGDVVTKEVVK